MIITSRFLVNNYSFLNSVHLKVLQFKKSTPYLTSWPPSSNLSIPVAFSNKLSYTSSAFSIHRCEALFLVEQIIFFPRAKGNFTSLDSIKASCFTILSLIFVVLKGKAERFFFSFVSNIMLHVLDCLFQQKTLSKK